MLTGDKLETAENIGESCHLIKKEMKVHKMATKHEAQEFLTDERI